MSNNTVEPRPIGPLTLVIRLLASEAIEGHLVGHAEVVRSGEVVSITDYHDLESLVIRLASEGLSRARPVRESLAAAHQAQRRAPRASPPPARPSIER